LAADLAIASPRVRADIVEAGEFPDLARRFNVYAVPKTVINGTSEVVGAVPEASFVQSVTAALAAAGDEADAPPAPS